MIRQDPQCIEKLEQASRLISSATERLAAAVVPKLTAVAPLKLVPVIPTEVPPAVEPLDGLMPETDGTGMT